MTFLAACCGIFALLFLAFCWLAARVDKADPERRERIRAHYEAWKS